MRLVGEACREFRHAGTHGRVPMDRTQSKAVGTQEHTVGRFQIQVRRLVLEIAPNPERVVDTQSYAQRLHINCFVNRAADPRVNALSFAAGCPAHELKGVPRLEREECAFSLNLFKRSEERRVGKECRL